MCVPNCISLWLCGRRVTVTVCVKLYDSLLFLHTRATAASITMTMTIMARMNPPTDALTTVTTNSLLLLRRFKAPSNNRNQIEWVKQCHLALVFKHTSFLSLISHITIVNALDKLIKDNAIDSPNKHEGSDPLHWPFAWHVRLTLPSSRKSLWQLYSANEPNLVLAMNVTEPSTGSLRSPQSTTAEV